MNPEHLLRPTRRPSAPAGLTNRVLQQIKNEEKMKKRQIIRLAASVAAVVVLGVTVPAVLITSANAAPQKTIAESIEQLVELNSYQIDFRIRTRPNEGFAYIDPSADFVAASFCRAADRWRIGYQGGRQAVFNGDSVFVWTTNMGLGYCGGASFQDGVLEGVVDLIDLCGMLQRELSALERKASQATLDKQDRLITLVAETPASGNFANPYMLNTSVGESYSRRTYVFDRSTKLLQAFTVEVVDKGVWATVIQSERIAYNQPIAASQWAIQGGLTWVDVQKAYSSPSLEGIAPERAAKLILSAFERSNTEPVKEALRFYDPQAFGRYLGLKVLSVGEPFRSGEYCGWFVPCRVKLKSGEVGEFNLALRNDNPNGVWTLDGGV